MTVPSTACNINTTYSQQVDAQIHFVGTNPATSNQVAGANL